MYDKNLCVFLLESRKSANNLKLLCHSVKGQTVSFLVWKKGKLHGAKSFKGYFLCRSNWLIVIKAWSSLIENVHFYQSSIATLIWKGHTWTYSLFYKCHDLIHFFWHFLCHKEGIFSVTFSSNFKLFCCK